MTLHRRLSLALVGLLGGCQTPNAAGPPVRPGVEVLLADSARLVTGRRVGLLTNQTGVDRRGVDDLTRLLEAGAQVTVLFSPEHGYHGVRDTSDIGDTVDRATGIPIFSLYGATRAPTPDMLERIDVLLVDLQDIGARPYTYVSTTLLAMRSAAAARVPVVVLDRPNPIGGVLVQGPILDTAFASFVGMLPVPLRHGMTLGELARFGNRILTIGAELSVVPADGWRREQWFDATGLPWVRPSPSMPDLESASHYPGLVLFEATNLSVGRGTPLAFQLVAAPWLDAASVIAAVGALPGVGLRDTVVVPRDPPDHKYRDRAVAAITLRVRDRASYDPVATALALWAAIGRVHGDSLKVDAARLARLAGVSELGQVIRGGRTAAVQRAWRAAAARFRRERAPYLLYR